MSSKRHDEPVHRPARRPNPCVPSTLATLFVSLLIIIAVPLMGLTMHERTAHATGPAETRDATGRARLLIRGKVTGGEQSLSFSQLRRIGTVELRTLPPWGEDEQQFRGVWLADILRAVDASGKDVEVLAKDGRSLGLPIDEAIANDAFVAFGRDGELLGGSWLGPFCLVFPLAGDERKQALRVRTMSLAGLREVRVR